MLSPPITVPIAFVHGMLSGVRALGHPVEPFLAPAGIAPELLLEEDSRVTAEQYVALFRTVSEQLDDNALGFLSRALRRGSFALIARSAIGTATLEAASKRAARTFGLLQDDVVVTLTLDGELAGMTFRFLNATCQRQEFLHGLLMRVFWRLMAWLAGGHLPIERFDFAFPAPAHAADYAKAFPAPHAFDGAVSAFWFDAKHLQDPVRRDENALKGFLADSEANIIVPRRADSVSARVRSHLQQTCPAWPDLGATAEEFSMAPSTLQRHLALEGTSFQALKDELRRDMAIVLLNTSTATFGALASQLGFSDSALFQRAFKGWTGSAPGVYRRRSL